jgi:ankyrin repeat protein
MIDKNLLANYLFENKLEYFKCHLKNNYIRKGENPFTREYDGGRAPLILSAVARGQLDFVKVMVEYGANVNFVDQSPFSDRKRTLLQIAIENDQDEVAEYLLANGAKINKVDLSDSSLHSEKLNLFVKKYGIEKLKSKLEVQLVDDEETRIPLRKRLKI